MSRERIEEMALTMVDSENKEVTNALSLFFANLSETLYNAGYRKSEWISVEERLPDKHGKYLVYRKCHCVSYVYIVYYDTNRSVWYFFDSEWGDCEVNDITHWMPLPEPPKMKGGAE